MKSQTSASQDKVLLLNSLWSVFLLFTNGKTKTEQDVFTCCSIYKYDNINSFIDDTENQLNSTCHASDDQPNSFKWLNNKATHHHKLVNTISQNSRTIRKINHKANYSSNRKNIKSIMLYAHTSLAKYLQNMFWCYFRSRFITKAGNVFRSVSFLLLFVSI